jgi:ankyrin repeat protein
MKSSQRCLPWWALCLSLAGSLSAASDYIRLADAEKLQDKEAVRSMLRRGIGVNAAQADGATALHWAAHWDDLETADLLLRRGAKPNVANDLGVTPLALAASNSSAAMTAKLLNAGADVNAATKAGETPLILASRAGAAAVVKLLLSKGAKVEAREFERGQTALMSATSESHPDVTALLVAAGAGVNTRSELGFTPLLFAARSGDVESAKILLAAGADVNLAAPDYGADESQMMWLLSGGEYERLHSSASTPLMVGIMSGHPKFAEYLLEHGADPRTATSGSTPLHAAVLIGDLDLVKALLARGVDVNARITRAFRRRVFARDLVFSPSWVGATPFFLAAKFAEVPIMRALADAGADPFLGNADIKFTFADESAGFSDFMGIPGKSTPFMVAAGSSWMDGLDRRNRVVAGLTQKGSRSSIEAVQFILELAKARGVDVIHQTDGGGNTALHGAARAGLDDVLEFLIANGAQIDAKSARGQTPLKAAQAASNGTTVALLKKLGATE